MLRQGVWYKIRTRVNNREPLFSGYKAPAIFTRVFRETELRFVFEVRGLRLEDDWLTFYIKPEDGLKLPAIMKWLKQTFAARYNRAEGRIGHIWGDRYWSGIVEGEPPEEEGTGGVTAAPDTGVRPHGGKTTGTPVFRSSPPALPRRPTVYTHLGEVLIKHKVRYTQKREETVMGIINFENYFNDKRLRGKKGASILDFLKREMRVIMQKADTWKEQMGYYRFWENKKVTEEELKECAVKQCAEQSAEMEEVHLLEDTTGINLERHRERIKDKGGLGSNYGRRGKGRQNKKEVLYFPRNNWNAWRSCLADMKAKGRNKGILVTGKI